MKRKMMKKTLAGLGMLLGVIAINGVLALPARAEVNVNVNIGPPPAVVVAEPPTMLFLGEPGVYVAVGVPYDIYFVGGRYYYFHGGNWFFASGYGGPWVHVVYRTLPPGLQRYKVVQLHEFREREYRVYKVQGPRFQGKHFDADPGPHGRHDREDHDDHDDHGPRNDHGAVSNGGGGKGPGNGKGGGRGHGHD